MRNILALSCFLLLLPGSALKASGTLQNGVAALAEDTQRFLKEQEEGTVRVGAFSGPALTSSGPGLGKLLTDELEKRRIRVVPEAKLCVQGRYRIQTDEKSRMLVARVEVEVVTRLGEVLGGWNRVVRFTPDPKATADLDGAGTLAILAGATVALSPGKSQRERHQALSQKLEGPKPTLAQGRVSAAIDCPYAIEILVEDKPREASLKDGHAFVEIRRGERYAIRLVNDAAHDVAVTLAIDGLSLFAFSDTPGYSHLMIPAHSSALVRGWHRNNKLVDSFVVTEYAKSAAAERLVTNTASIGTITATFAAAWEKNSRPPADEKYASGDRSDATGRGPAIKQDFAEVERHVGLVRGAISVRYTKPEMK